MCGREQPLTFHHFICRTVHRNKWFRKRYTREQMQEGVDICRDCHSAVHRFIPDEKVMARQYNTLEKLLEHPQVAGYVEWVRDRGVGKVRTRTPSGTTRRGGAGDRR